MVTKAGTRRVPVVGFISDEHYKFILLLLRPGPLWRGHTNEVGLLGDNRRALLQTRTGRADLIEDIREVFGAYLTGHSFRRGAVVQLVEQGTPLTVIQALGTWSSAETVLAYCEEAVRLSPSLTSRLFLGGQMMPSA